MQTKFIPDFFLFRWSFFRKSNKKNLSPTHGWRISTSKLLLYSHLFTNCFPFLIQMPR